MIDSCNIYLFEFMIISACFKSLVHISHIAKVVFNFQLMLQVDVTLLWLINPFFKFLMRSHRPTTGPTGSCPEGSIFTGDAKCHRCFLLQRRSSCSILQQGPETSCCLCLRTHPRSIKLSVLIWLKKC